MMAQKEKVCDAGFEHAQAIIDRCALLYPGPQYT